MAKIEPQQRKQRPSSSLSPLLSSMLIPISSFGLLTLLLGWSSAMLLLGFGLQTVITVMAAAVLSSTRFVRAVVGPRGKTTRIRPEGESR